MDSMCRLWVVVTSVSPLRVYVFNGGFLVFGAKRPEPAMGLDPNDEVSLLACPLVMTDQTSPLPN